MLIVNADDWGRSEVETNAALDCYRHGSVTAVSAMVFMKDSERAADIAKNAGFDVGLHLNLTEPFTSTGVPPQVLEAQGRIAAFLTQSKYALLFYRPGLRREFRVVYDAQAQEFRRLYGREPSHVDGHQHMHHCMNMMVDRLIPGGQRVRRNFSFWPGEKGLCNRLYRRLMDCWLGRTYVLTDYFFSLEQCLKQGKLGRVAKLSRSLDCRVELMTHPERKPEFEFLMNEEFVQFASGLRTVNFAAV
jgi:predicted glycoside hydrolase/deacetylase ChbG (UPF0249 family)